jgi:hypothetical protein
MKVVRCLSTIVVPRSEKCGSAAGHRYFTDNRPLQRKSQEASMKQRDNARVKKENLRLGGRRRSGEGWMDGYSTCDRTGSEEGGSLLRGRVPGGRVAADCRPAPARDVRRPWGKVRRAAPAPILDSLGETRRGRKEIKQDPCQSRPPSMCRNRKPLMAGRSRRKKTSEPPSHGCRGRLAICNFCPVL